MENRLHAPISLPWTASAADERRFRLIVGATLIIAAVFSMTIPLIEVPKPERDEIEKLPPRLAKLILEQKKPEPVRVEAPKPEAEEKKPEEPKPEEKKQEPKPEPKKQSKNIEAARKKAAGSGVLAMRDMLADLREAQPVESIRSKKQLQTGGQEASQQTRSVLTAKNERSSSGIDTSKFSRDIGGTELSGHQTTTVVSKIDNVKAETTKKDTSQKNAKGRTLEDIHKIIEANYASIYIIYQRALRKNPALQGRVVFKITIAPSGEVTLCSITSSDLNDKSLERKLVLRIKSIDFGAQKIDITTVTYPINFLPNN